MKENTAVLHAQVPVDVATYLLNEKRAEIHAIEARLKVNVILIPNIHLETPNYNITRLRHDDVKLGEVQTSYQMVEKPAQEIALPSAAQEAKPARQQAAVRGITPSQPAPVREQKPPHREPQQLSFLDKIFGWFKQMSGEERKVHPEQVTTHPQRPERGRGRRDRVREGRDGDYNEKLPRGNQRARDERGGEAPGVSGPARETAAQRPERGEAKLQGERSAQKKQQRAPREEKIRIDAKLSAGEERPATEDSLQQSEDGGRRRRRGGRQRDRSERSERIPHESKQASGRDLPPQQAGGQATLEKSLPPTAVAIPEPIQETSEPIVASSSRAMELRPEPETTTTPASLQMEKTIPPAAEAAVQDESLEPRSIPVLVEPETASGIQPPTQESILEPSSANAPSSATAVLKPFKNEVEVEDEIPVPTIQSTFVPERVQSPQHQAPHAAETPNLAESGLIMIETTPEKIRPTEANVVDEPGPAERRRKRPAPTPLVEHDEPLVQIETHK